MRRITPRDLTLYLLVIFTLVFAVSSLQSLDQDNGPDYSTIRSYFEQERVTYFSLRGNDLTLTLRLSGNQSATLTCRLADASRFYEDMHELIDRQLEEGILTGYDYPPGIEASWWYNLLPYLVALLMLGFFFAVIMRQRMNVNGGGGPAANQNRFGHARARVYSDKDKQVTFQDVAGADEEKEELKEVVDFLQDPQKFIRLGARIPQGHSAGRTSGNRQNAAGPGSGRGSRRAVPLHFRLGFRGALCGYRRQPGPGSL